MVRQEYVVTPPRGNAYRIVVEVRDEPIVASRGARTISLDAAWVKREADAFLTRNKDYSGLVPYFSGYLKGLHTIGILDIIEAIAIPSEVPPPELEKNEKDAPQQLWVAWQQM